MRMHYWNQDNFDGLLDLAAALDAQPGFGALAEYCRLRERGLRAGAFAALDRFLIQAAAWDPPTRQVAVDVLLQLAHRTPQCHQFLVHPLLQRFVHPTLRHWREADPAALVPLRWQGLLKGDAGLLRLVLARHPDDDVVRRRLCGYCLADVDYATHHLHEGLFIGELADAEAALAEAASLLATAPEPGRFADEATEVAYFTRMLDDWREYSARPDGDFKAWCVQRRRDYAWPSTVYYSSGDAGSADG